MHRNGWRLVAQPLALLLLLLLLRCEPANARQSVSVMVINESGGNLTVGGALGEGQWTAPRVDQARIVFGPKGMQWELKDEERTVFGAEGEGVGDVEGWLQIDRNGRTVGVVKFHSPGLFPFRNSFYISEQSPRWGRLKLSDFERRGVLGHVHVTVLPPEKMPFTQSWR